MADTVSTETAAPTLDEIERHVTALLAEAARINVPVPDWPPDDEEMTFGALLTAASWLVAEVRQLRAARDAALALIDEAVGRFPATRGTVISVTVDVQRLRSVLSAAPLGVPSE